MERELERRQKQDGRANNWVEGRFRVLGYEWRVLRFNDVTRQSVAKVIAVVHDKSPSQVFLVQQPNCIAFECEWFSFKGMCALSWWWEGIYLCGGSVQCNSISRLGPRAVGFSDFGGFYKGSILSWNRNMLLLTNICRCEECHCGDCHAQWDGPSCRCIGIMIWFQLSQG